MPNSILDGLSLVDSVGQSLLVVNAACLLLGVVAHVFLRTRYRMLRKDLDAHPELRTRFDNPVLNRIVQEAEEDARRSRDPNTQAIIEDVFHSELRPWLALERFVRGATALVLIIGLLGTFYGLTVSIGRLVHLVAADPGTGDVAQALTRGLTQSLSGMAAAFSNSLVGVASAVVLSVLGVANNVTDQRTALMVSIETYLARRLPPTGATADDIGAFVSSFAEAVGRLQSTVARFDEALGGFSAATRDLRELHLVVAVKPGGSR